MAPGISGGVSTFPDGPDVGLRQSKARIEDVLSINAHSHGIAILGSGYATLAGCTTSDFMNDADPVAPTSGLFIRAKGTFVTDHLADEGAVGASVYIDGDDNRIQGAKVYAVGLDLLHERIGAHVAGGSRNTIVNADVRPWGVGVAEFAILIDGAANSTTLVGVTSDDGSGNPAIKDKGTGTVMVGVNGVESAGGGHLLAWSIEQDPCQEPATAVGNWVTENSGGGERRYNTSGAQGDKVVLPPVVLAAGTWDIEVTLDGQSGGSPISDITTYLDDTVLESSWTPTPSAPWIHHIIPGAVVDTTGKEAQREFRSGVGRLIRLPATERPLSEDLMTVGPA